MALAARTDCKVDEINCRAGKRAASMTEIGPYDAEPLAAIDESAGSSDSQLLQAHGRVERLLSLVGQNHKLCSPMMWVCLQRD
jgi:hypothetical protein